MFDSSVNVVRAGVLVLTGVAVDIQPLDPYPFVRPQMPAAPGETIYDSYVVYTQTLPMPDIRARDQLIDPGDIDPLTLQPAVYYVRRVHTWDGSLYADRVATKPTT